MNARLIKGDCLKKMKELPDGSIDAILTDPPYGTSACRWDSVIPLEPMWEELRRIVKPDGPIVLFGNEPYTSRLIMSNIDMFKYMWYWQKERGANFLNFQYQPAKTIEGIIVFGSMATSYSKNGTLVYYPQMESGKPYSQKQGYIGDSVARDTASRENHKNIVTKNDGKRYPGCVLSFKTEKGFHATQKPVPLMEYLLQTYTKVGDTVLDFAMGSGTTGVACVNLDRNFIGIELEEKSYLVAEKRIDEAMKV